MTEYLPVLMFPALFVLVFLGIPVSFALIVIAFGVGLTAFGDRIWLQLYGPILGTASNFVLASIPLFVLMGAILERSGIALRLFRATQVWLGRLPGGLAITTLVMCAIFAAASGVVGAVEIVVGLMAIPAMMSYRYNRALIAGTICAGGSLGTIIPPSIVVVVYASIAQMSIGELLAGIMLPGLIMVGLFLLYVLVRCLLRPADGPPIAAAEADIPLSRKIRITLNGLVPASVLIVAVLGSILAGVASPTEAAAVGVLGAFVLAAMYRELNAAVMREALVSTVKITAMIMFIVLGGTMFTGIFAVTGGGRLLARTTAELGLSPAMMIALFLLIIFLAGFVLDWISTILICIPIFAPLVKAAGIDPLWFAVMVVVAVQTSYLTPPMAPSIFYLRAIAPREITYWDMCRGVAPFVALQLVTLALVAAFPALAVWLPKVILG